MDQTIGNVFIWIWENAVKLFGPLFKNLGKFLFSFIQTDIGWACFWVIIVFIVLNLLHIKLSPKNKGEFLLFFFIYVVSVWLMYNTCIGRINKYAGLEVVGSTMVVLGSFRFFFDPIYKFILSCLPKPKPQPPGK
jgi:hypothetical protein